ncbi:HK97 family phage prohead protease, partial [Cypionkella sp.]|uniref:HK97 family phage prohead protease n=1 Tax=Cypionkella sp. TaxID=2811411 RepID=UPI002AB83212
MELRKRASQGLLQLQGRFPYNSTATLHSGGNGQRPRKEQFASRAFSYVVDGEGADRDVHFLVGHSFDRPLASRSAGTLTLTDSDEALIFVADITEDLQRAQYVSDFLRMLTAGLIGGISPGFRVAPPEAVDKA